MNSINEYLSMVLVNQVGAILLQQSGKKDLKNAELTRVLIGGLSDTAIAIENLKDAGVCSLTEDQINTTLARIELIGSEVKK